MRDAPRVSVVVPTYNRAASLERLLAALAACARPPGGVEFLIVDDGSTDSTDDVLARSPLPGLTALHQVNGGAASARNRGWRAARGEVVAFTDDDCIPSCEWLVELTSALDEHMVDGIGGSVVPLHDNLLGHFVQAERMVSHGGDAATVKYLVTANAAFRRGALEEVGGFDERFPGAAGEDTDLTFRMQAHGLALTIVNDARVAHDHRATFSGVLRTYFRHGRAWMILARVHHDRQLGTRSTSMTRPRYWRDRYLYYRSEGAAGAAAVGYCALRGIGLVCFASGMARESMAMRHAAES